MKKTKVLISCFSALSTITVYGQIKERPNIIYILMDDLGYGDIGCYGQQKIETPNIDQLCKDGIQFTQHYSGSPVSAPARCVLMTGMHSGHAQIRFNNELPERGAVNNYDSMYIHKDLEGQYPLKTNTMTLGRMMQNAGYVTGCFGKWGLGYPGSEGTPNKQGFDQFFGYNCQRQAHTYYPAFLYKNEDRIYLNNKVMNPHTARLTKNEDPYDAQNYKKFKQNDYANDLIFEELIKFVDYNSLKPFFLMWTTPLPHVSLQAPEKWIKYYVEKFGNEDPYTGTTGYLPCRYPHATYAAMISYFDQQIGELIETLKNKNLYNNTLIIFTSDNGPTFNGGSDSPWFNSGGIFKSEYGWGKCFLHEGGIRVPAIMVWNGKITPGTKTDHICSFQDVMPTLAEITKINCPQTDGISFLPTLLGEINKQRQHEYLYWEYPDPQIGNKAIRMGKWKGIIENTQKGNIRMQLYDLENDIREQYDVAQSYPEIVKKLKYLMNKASDNPNNKDR